MLYIPVNYFGFYIFDHQVYYQSAELNWSNPKLTLGIFIGQAVFMALINFITAVILQKIHGYNESARTWPQLVRSLSNLNEAELSDLKASTHS